ncbi:mCG145464, partial [Mus musculus]
LKAEEWAQRLRGVTLHQCQCGHGQRLQHILLQRLLPLETWIYFIVSQIIYCEYSLDSTRVLIIPEPNVVRAQRLTSDSRREILGYSPGNTGLIPCHLPCKQMV